MAVRKTKQQREAGEKAALRRRVLDMAFGAFGGYSNATDIDPSQNPEHSGMFYQMNPEAIGRWIGAVAEHLMPDVTEPKYLLKPHCLEKWDSLDGIVDALYGMGVRA